MAYTEFQASILRALAETRATTGESYVAGGVALNTLIKSSRVSRGIDLFHDTEAALRQSWLSDRDALVAGGYDVDVVCEAPSFVEAAVSQGKSRTTLQWARDSAFRFFPLIKDNVIGLTLHAFDLATNKVLAMAGRLEVRAWVDVLNCDRALQPLGYLIWAACSKDPRYNPQSLLSMVRRQHYSQEELDSLDFDGLTPSAADLGLQWHNAQDDAADVVRLLPPDKMGMCVLDENLELYAGSAAELKKAIGANGVRYHSGRIGGAWPRVVDS
jgi:hypothetical protein